jgi:hypothetical protein
MLLLILILLLRATAVTAGTAAWEAMAELEEPAVQVAPRVLGGPAVTVAMAEMEDPVDAVAVAEGALPLESSRMLQALPPDGIMISTSEIRGAGAIKGSPTSAPPAFSRRIENWARRFEH